MLETEASEYDLQCFWSDEMSLEENHIVNFNWYYLEISPHFTVKEALSMLESLLVKVCIKKSQ